MEFVITLAISLAVLAIVVVVGWKLTEKGSE